MVNEGLTLLEVADAVCAELGRRGWVVEDRTAGSERWCIAARGPGSRHLTVEARGARCSNERSLRRGRVYTRDEIASQVARSLHTLSQSASADLRAMALPATPSHRAYVRSIRPTTGRFAIGFFWVDEERGTQLDAPWSLDA